MTDMSKWEGGKQLTPEEEGEYLKDLCAYLRKQQTLSEPTKNEDGVMTCEIVDDEVAAHVADIIEELWGRVQEIAELKSLLAKHHTALVEQQKPGPWPAKEVIDKAVAAEREARALEAKKVAWPEGYEIHELPADYTGPVWIEGQVRRLFDYVNREECMNEDIPKSAADNTEQMLIDAMRSTMAVAWGYLWHITTNDMRVNGARKMLLDMIQASGISNEEFFEMKRYGLKEAKKDGCLVNIHEIESSALWGEE